MYRRHETDRSQPGRLWMTEPLSPRVCEFLTAHVDSIGLLEVLLALAAEPGMSFTAERVSDHLRTSPMSAHRSLRLLRERKLVEVLPDGSFRFAAGEALAELVRAVGDAYRERRLTVMSLIYARR